MKRYFEEEEQDDGKENDLLTKDADGGHDKFERTFDRKNFSQR